MHGPEEPEWWLVGVGIVTFIVIAWQAIETRVAAQAAAGSTQALVNSERAWLVVEILPVCQMFGNQWHRRATLVIHGWVEYQHVFDRKNPERANFCYSYSPETRRLNKVAQSGAFGEGGKRSGGAK